MSCAVSQYVRREELRTLWRLTGRVWKHVVRKGRSGFVRWTETWQVLLRTALRLFLRSVRKWQAAHGVSREAWLRKRQAHALLRHRGVA